MEDSSRPSVLLRPAAVPAELRDREVSRRVLGVFWDAARRSSIPPERLAEGSGRTVDQLTPSSDRISWATFAAIARNAGTVWSDDELQQIGARAFEHPLIAPFAVVGRLLYTVPEFYLWFFGPGGPGRGMFAPVTSSIHEVGPGALVCESRMSPGYPVSRENLLLQQGSLTGMSAILGYAPAEVSLELLEDGGRFHIRVPQRGGRLGWIRRRVGWLGAARSAARELQDAHDALNERYVELQRQIAARTAAEQAERKAHLGLERILGALPVGCIVHDPTGRVTYANPAIERLFGERLAGGIDDLVGTDVLTPVLAGGTVGPVRRDGIAADGRECRIEWWHTPLTDQGRVIGLVSTCIDVGEQERLEQRLAAAHKLETVGRLAGGVAHDFNNLLTVILTSSEMVAAALPVDEPRRADLVQLQRATHRGAELVHQLLAYGRQQVLKPALIEVDRTITEVTPMLRSLIRDDVGLRIVAGAGTATIRADPAQLERVVVNLVVNASDATPRGGRITVETRTAEVVDGGEVDPGSYVLIAVTDTGKGMDRQTVERVFEPFFSTKPGGGGLGLSTVQGIVEQSSGRVVVRSERDRGSTFEVYLPRVEEARAERAPPERAPSKAGGSETVMVVEDEDAIRRLACRVLRGAGYAVVDAASPASALELLGTLEAPVHLLLTDVVMPGMSGVELARRLLAERPATRVLFMSGYAPSDELHEIVDEGAAFLGKPFTAGSLAAAVRAALDGP